jgi:endonuclease YncB( thermonuclease family)
MRRRGFLSAAALTALASAVPGVSTGTVRASTTERIDPLEFDSTASLLDADGTRLTDSSRVAVQAASTATNQDADGAGDAVDYGTDPIPLVAVEGSVVGFGAELVGEWANFRSGNEEFLLNVWDAKLGGSGTVLYDEGHDQDRNLSDFENFANYAENEGYTVQATDQLTTDLTGADAAWITGPATAFTASERQSLAEFVANGGAVFVHDRADYGSDRTANLNAIAATLGLGFRFNDDQVVDETNNGGAFYRPTTDQFDTDYPFFADRPGMGIDPNATHTVDVIDVADGDTVDIRFDSGREETIRVLGQDTPEKEANQRYERIQEWEGIGSLDYLATWGANASQFAKSELTGKTVDIAFDPEEAGIFDEYRRLLAYIYYDASGDGTRDDLYNLRGVEEGYARLYSSAFAKHETFYDAEATARANGRGVWGDSDPDAASEFRNRSVAEAYFPKPATVRTATGGVPTDRVAVTAEDTATQTVDGGHSYDGDLPLVAVDEETGVGVVGGLPISEDYEKAEDFAVDTAGFENFTLVSNLVDLLSAREGDLLVDGGHGQFVADFALGSEDVAYYQRHLEGLDVGLEQVNGEYANRLGGARAILVTPPTEAFTATEKSALQSHVDSGGAVVLMGGSNASATARQHLNDLASALGTDLRLNADAVTDGTNNVDADETIPTTAAFDDGFPILDAYPSVADGTLAVQSVHADAAGNEYENLDDEYVVFENTGEAPLDLSGWTVSDEAGWTYTVPGGVRLAGGATITLRTGSGTDTTTDLYWGRGAPVWNNGGDTITVEDDTGTTVLEYTYPQSSGDGALAVESVHADAAGNEYDNLDDEYVVFENAGDAVLDLTGYTCEDAAGTTYTFPDGFSLDPGSTVTLRTGSGTDSATDLYWGSASPIWNNSGDTVVVKDGSGSIVLEYPY